jgi:hypothetical protein
MRHQLFGFVDKLPVDGMFNLSFYSYDNGFVHFIADNNTDTFFSEIPFHR